MQRMTAVATPTDLQRLDHALSRLRRLWESAAVRKEFLARLGEPVEPALIRTLRAIETLAESTEAPGVRDVAAHLCNDVSTASRLIEAAVRARYVTRTESETDRRRCVLALSPDGRALLDRANNVREVMLGEWVKEWPSSDVAAMAVLVERLGSAVFQLETALPRTAAAAR